MRSNKNRRKALYVAKSCNVKVAVHSSSSTKTDSTVYPGYRLDYYDVNEKRHQPYFADFNDAKAAADTLARDLALGEHQDQTSGSSLSKEEVADYRRLQKLTADLGGISLFDFLTRDAIPALLTLKDCGFDSLSDSATYYCRGFKGKPSMTVAEAIDIALAQKQPVWAPKSYDCHKAAWEKLSAAYGSKNIRDLDITDVADVLLRATGRVSTRAAAARSTITFVPAFPIGPLPLPVDESNHVPIQKGKETRAQI